jgi:hypothetical protein
MYGKGDALVPAHEATPTPTATPATHAVIVGFMPRERGPAD